MREKQGEVPPDIQALLDESDRACREAEKVRAQVERAMNQDPFWPDRRDPSRPDEKH